MTLLGWISDPFKRLSDLQLGDEKVTLNHLEFFLFDKPKPTICFFSLKCLMNYNVGPYDRYEWSCNLYTRPCKWIITGDISPLRMEFHDPTSNNCFLGAPLLKKCLKPTILPPPWAPNPGPTLRGVANSLGP